jgi:hypothetical protein
VEQTMKKILLMILLFCCYAFSQNPNLGTSGAKFLQIPIGARAAAIGGACIGISNDAASVFWNPAGISDISSSAVHFSYLRWFDMFDLNAASAVHNFGDYGIIGVSIISFSTDKMEITTESSPNGTGQYFDAQDLAIGISYARNLTDRFSAGLTLKYVNQTIWNESSSGLAFDIGTKYRLDFNNLTIAMCMTNFGSDLKLDGSDLNVTYDKSTTLPLNRLTPARLVTDDYPLPLNFQVGVGLDIFTSEVLKIKTEIDAVHPNDNKERILAGIECEILGMLYLRGGYKYNYDDEDLTFGLGANIPLDKTSIKFDYAFSVYHILPSVHRISVSLEF